MGNPFLTTIELVQQRDEAQARAERLAEQWRELGVEPNEVGFCLGLGVLTLVGLLCNDAHLFQKLQVFS